MVHNSLESNWFRLTAGVPQGSVLSPFLFLVYINDIEALAVASRCEISMFADDIVAWPCENNAAGDRALQDFLDQLGPWSSRWKVLFGQKKTQAMCFTRQKEAQTPASFRLADFTLDLVSHYKYLGVFFQSNMKWQRQTNEVLARVSRVAAVISNVTVPRKPPGLRCVRMLVEALMVPIVGYGLPIWQLPAKRACELHQLLARPLRCCLSLPQRSTHAQSVLVDCGLPSFDQLHQLAALRLGLSLHRLDGTDPCKPLLFEREDPIAVIIRNAERAVNCSSSDATAVAAAPKLLRRAQHNAWLFDAGGPQSLKAVKLRPGISQHLMLDDRVVCTMRARLRFNRSSLNASLAERKVTSDARCQNCGVPETTEHCLLYCQLHDTGRAACQQLLAAMNVPFGVDTVLGSPDAVPNSRDCPAVLTITGDFLRTIDTVRRL